MIINGDAGMTVSFLQQILREYRETYNLTQEQVADEIGISRNWLSKIERGMISRCFRSV